MGTRKIENESWSIVWERMCGPTGHPSLLEGFESEYNQSGIEPEVIVNAKSSQCWRDVKLVKELVNVRINVVKAQWKLSKEKNGSCARILASVLPNLEMKKLWSRVDQVRRETWMEEHSLKQRKTEHLLKVSRDCTKHSMCKKLNQLTTDRLRTWVTGRGPGTSSADPPSPKLSSPCECVNQLPSVKPNLHPVFMDKTVDLSHIRMEEEQLLAMVYDFNDNLVTEGNVPENEVVVSDGCNLTDDKLSLLNLGPGFMVASTLDPEEMEVESVVTLTKIRWGRRSKGQETMTNEEIAKEEMENPENEYQESLTEAMEIAARDVIEEEKISVNMRKKRATDMRNNRNVFMPGPGPAKVESSHTVRMGVWTETFNDYRRRHCDDKGAPLKKNLTIGQQITLKSLGRKIARLELLVLEADKGKRFVVTTEKTYKAMASDHVAKDKMASICEIRSCQRVLSCTAKAMVNMFGTGMDQGWRNYSRCFDNAGSEAEDAPVPKVHKPPMAAGHPASRPVVAAATGISSRAGDVLADFLEPLVLLGTPRQEDQSTEEVLSQLEDVQAAIKASGSRNTMVGSLDVKALYPSLDQDAAAEVVAQLVYESEVRFNGINWRCVQTFLASNHTEEELKQQGIAHLIPDRVFSLGRRPGPTTPELSMKIPQDKEMPPYSKWKSTDIRTLTSQQKKLLLTRAVKTAVKVIFKNHVYQFGGVYYLQVSGGPIGLRLTSVVARIVMDRWSLLFLAKLDNSGWQLWAMMKYVDDVNLVLEMMDTNVVWEGEGQQKLVSVDKVERQGAKKETTKEDHTMSLVQKAANSVFPWLEFTADLPSDHSSQMVPMLDLQVWVNHHQVHPAGSGDPAGSFSQDLHVHRPLPGGAGDPQEVTSQDLEDGAAPLPGGAGDPPVVTSQDRDDNDASLPGGVGDPPVVSSQGLDDNDASLSGGAGDPPVVTSQDPDDNDASLPGGAGDPPVVTSQDRDDNDASLPGGAGDPPVVTSQDLDDGACTSLPGGAGDPPVVPSQDLDDNVASLPGGAGDPPVVTSQDQVEGDTLMWTFYEKPTSSSRVLKATLAYTWCAKLVTLNMEVFRRLRNTSRQVTIMFKGVDPAQVCLQAPSQWLCTSHCGWDSTVRN